MEDLEKDLTPKQYKALTMLLAGYTYQEVADKTGVNKKTIERWKKLPTFTARMREAQHLCFQSAIAELIVDSRYAATELNRIIKNPETSDRIKISAIQTAFSFASKVPKYESELNSEYVESNLDDNSENESEKQANISNLINTMLRSNDENTLLKALELKRKYMETESKLKEKYALTPEEFADVIQNMINIVKEFLPSEKLPLLSERLNQIIQFKDGN
jgi:transcriptional regulator with XRE-family HTH domain